MNSHEPESDPLESLLTGIPSGTSEELRQTIQRKTLTVLRWRRWLRRSFWTAVLTACYAAGILTMALLRNPAPQSTVASEPEIEPTEKTSSHQVTKEKPERVQPPDSALALEWRALDSEQKRPDLFLLAGDKYLQVNDLKSAMRCYRGALDGAKEEELLITARDTWLLMSLKEAKLQENRYAKLVGP
jgi:hypothetical protein